MKCAVHFGYAGTAGPASAASFARRSWPESRSGGAAAQRGQAVTGVLARSAGQLFSRTMSNINATLLPALVGTQPRLAHEVPRWGSWRCSDPTSRPSTPQAAPRMAADTGEILQSDCEETAKRWLRNGDGWPLARRTRSSDTRDGRGRDGPEAALLSGSDLIG